MTTRIKVLITGSNGFVGRWLAEHLLSQGYEVHGTDLMQAGGHPSISFHQTDLLESNRLVELCAGIQPDRVYHLAAVTYLPDADRSPRRSLDINISGTIAVLDAVRSTAPHARVLVVGSSKEYGDAPDADAVSENFTVEPTNFYGISKLAGELVGKQYHRQFGLDVRCTRSFNHSGPGQSPRFVCSDWARQVASISLGLQPPTLVVGDLDAVMDFSDVRDVVRAYTAILETGRPGEAYNVCSGNGVALEWIIAFLCGKNSFPISLKSDEAKRRHGQPGKKMVGSHDKLTADTKWKPEIPFTQTLDDLYDWWIAELTKRG